MSTLKQEMTMKITILTAIMVVAASTFCVAAQIPWSRAQMVIVNLGDNGEYDCYDQVAHPDSESLSDKPFWQIETINQVKYFCHYETAQQLQDEREAERNFERAADCYMGRTKCK
jgi:hypothetical protein